MKERQVNAIILTIVTLRGIRMKNVRFEEQRQFLKHLSFRWNFWLGPVFRLNFTGRNYGSVETWDQLSLEKKSYSSLILCQDQSLQKSYDHGDSTGDKLYDKVVFVIVWDL